MPKGHKLQCKCGPCKAKRGEQFGKDNPYYKIDAKSRLKYYCIEKGCKMNVTGPNRRCINCSQRGERSHLYKHGKTLLNHFCIDCNKKVSYQSVLYGLGRCKSCNNKNIIHTEERIKKMKLGLRKKWKEPKFRAKMLKIRKEQWTEESLKKYMHTLLSNSYHGKTDIEKYLINIIKKYRLDYKFCGDGSVIIGKKCPDFINNNGEKLLIEVFYDYFKIKSYGSVENYKKIRSQIFKRYGFKTLFLDYKQVMDSKEEEIAELIRKFS